MSFGIGSLTSQANQALTPLQQYEQQLLKPYTQASTGKRILSAADDPSGLAIAETLSSQAAGFDQGGGNALNAGQAVNVADGALQTTQDALSSLRSLAVQASNDLLSPSQRQDLQTVANQLVAQINTDAQNANFNGTPLLNGTYGTQSATTASATVTTNAALAQGGQLVAGVNASPTATGGTIGLSVVGAGTGALVDVRFTDTTTGTTVDMGLHAGHTTFTVDGTTVTLGGVSAGDLGTNAAIQVKPSSRGSHAPDAQVQTGASEGTTTPLTLPNATSSALFLQHVDLSNTAAATNAIGQVDAALAATTSARATLGAQGTGLQTQVSSDATASNALTASASAIGDANLPKTSTELYKLLVQQQISLRTLQNSNTQFGYLNRFLNASS
jgi:flagellin